MELRLKHVVPGG